MSAFEKVDISLNNDIKSLKSSLFKSIVVETHPIVIQLEEFGYDPIYSRRVLYYLHPEDLEEALNYMSVENGIIQHRFVFNRRVPNNICYICGEEEKYHLKELNNSNEDYKNNLKINSYQSEEDQKDNNDINDLNKNTNYINTQEDLIDNSERISKEVTIKELTENIDIPEINTKNEEKITNSVNNEVHNSFCNNDIKESNLNSKQNMNECEICNELFYVNNTNKNELCGHYFCNNCWYDSFSVKIKENKIPSIKCLKYECNEKLSDEFIINILNNDINLIKKYKRYKLELEIINSPNKKLCPYPNCDSYLEQKDLLSKYIPCKNNHIYCFYCLEKPHGNSPCNESLASSMVEYAKNNFVKKCPQCSIITEKNNGCNHITCTKCGYQWCWLCNEQYNPFHFQEGKCKGFQFFQPKNNYDIKLLMEGKINMDELPLSQRQYNIHVNDNNENNNNNFAINQNPIIEPIRTYHDEIFNVGLGVENEIFNINHRNKLYYNFKNVSFIIFYIFFGNLYFIINILSGKNYFIKYNIIFILIFIAFFFQLIFLNIISLILIIIFSCCKKLDVKLYFKRFILIILHLLMHKLIWTLNLWEDKFKSKRIVFFPFVILCTINIFPQILINAVIIFIRLLRKRNFHDFFDELESMLEDLLIIYLFPLI